jgi:hypothetical protein
MGRVATGVNPKEFGDDALDRVTQHRHEVELCILYRLQSVVMLKHLLSIVMEVGSYTRIFKREEREREEGGREKGRRERGREIRS